MGMPTVEHWSAPPTGGSRWDDQEGAEDLLIPDKAAREKSSSDAQRRTNSSSRCRRLKMTKLRSFPREEDLALRESFEIAGLHLPAGERPLEMGKLLVKGCALFCGAFRIPRLSLPPLVCIALEPNAWGSLRVLLESGATLRRPDDYGHIADLSV